MTDPRYKAIQTVLAGLIRKQLPPGSTAIALSQSLDPIVGFVASPGTNKGDYPVSAFTLPEGNNPNVDPVWHRTWTVSVPVKNAVQSVVVTWWFCKRKALMPPGPDSSGWAQTDTNPFFDILLSCHRQSQKGSQYFGWRLVDAQAKGGADSVCTEKSDLIHNATKNMEWWSGQTGPVMRSESAYKMYNKMHGELKKKMQPNEAALYAQVRPVLKDVVASRAAALAGPSLQQKRDYVAGMTTGVSIVRFTLWSRADKRFGVMAPVKALWANLPFIGRKRNSTMEELLGLYKSEDVDMTKSYRHRVLARAANLKDLVTETELDLWNAHSHNNVRLTSTGTELAVFLPAASLYSLFAVASSAQDYIGGAGAASRLNILIAPPGDVKPFPAAPEIPLYTSEEVTRVSDNRLSALLRHNWKEVADFSKMVASGGETLLQPLLSSLQIPSIEAPSSFPKTTEVLQALYIDGMYATAAGIQMLGYDSAIKNLRLTLESTIDNDARKAKLASAVFSLTQRLKEKKQAQHNGRLLGGALLEPTSGGVLNALWAHDSTLPLEQLVKSELTAITQEFHDEQAMTDFKLAVDKAETDYNLEMNKVETTAEDESRNFVQGLLEKFNGATPFKPLTVGETESSFFYSNSVLATVFLPFLGAQAVSFERLFMMYNSLTPMKNFRTEVQRFLATPTGQQCSAVAMLQLETYMKTPANAALQLRFISLREYVVARFAAWRGSRAALTGDQTALLLVAAADRAPTQADVLSLGVSYMPQNVAAYRIYRLLNDVVETSPADLKRAMGNVALDDMALPAGVVVAEMGPKIYQMVKAGSNWPTGIHVFRHLFHIADLVATDTAAAAVAGGLPPVGNAMALELKAIMTEAFPETGSSQSGAYTPATFMAALGASEALNFDELTSFGLRSEQWRRMWDVFRASYPRQTATVMFTLDLIRHCVATHVSDSDDNLRSRNLFGSQRETLESILRDTHLRWQHGTATMYLQTPAPWANWLKNSNMPGMQCAVLSYGEEDAGRTLVRVTRNGSLNEDDKENCRAVFSQRPTAAYDETVVTVPSEVKSIPDPVLKALRALIDSDPKSVWFTTTTSMLENTTVKELPVQFPLTACPVLDHLKISESDLRRLSDLIWPHHMPMWAAALSLDRFDRLLAQIEPDLMNEFRSLVGNKDEMAKLVKWFEHRHQHNQLLLAKEWAQLLYNDSTNIEWWDPRGWANFNDHITGVWAAIRGGLRESNLFPENMAKKEFVGKRDTIMSPYAPHIEEQVLRKNDALTSDQIETKIGEHRDTYPKADWSYLTSRFIGKSYSPYPVRDITELRGSINKNVASHKKWDKFVNAINAFLPLNTPAKSQNQVNPELEQEVVESNIVQPSKYEANRDGLMVEKRDDTRALNELQAKLVDIGGIEDDGEPEPEKPAVGLCILAKLFALTVSTSQAMPFPNFGFDKAMIDGDNSTTDPGKHLQRAYAYFAGVNSQRVLGQAILPLLITTPARTSSGNGLNVTGKDDNAVIRMLARTVAHGAASDQKQRAAIQTVIDAKNDEFNQLVAATGTLPQDVVDAARVLMIHLVCQKVGIGPQEAANNIRSRLLLSDPHGAAQRAHDAYPGFPFPLAAATGAVAAAEKNVFDTLLRWAEPLLQLSVMYSSYRVWNTTGFAQHLSLLEPRMLFESELPLAEQ